MLLGVFTYFALIRKYKILAWMNHRRRQNFEEISICATRQSPAPKGLALAKFSLYFFRAY